jgi:hypothetical protein
VKRGKKSFLQKSNTHTQMMKTAAKTNEIIISSTSNLKNSLSLSELKKSSANFLNSADPFFKNYNSLGGNDDDRKKMFFFNFCFFSGVSQRSRDVYYRL